MNPYNKLLNDSLYRDNLNEKRADTGSKLNHWFVRNHGVQRTSFPIMYEPEYQYKALKAPGNISESYWDTLTQADTRWDYAPVKSQLGDECRDLWKQHNEQRSLKDGVGLGYGEHQHGAFSTDPMRQLVADGIDDVLYGEEAYAASPKLYNNLTTQEGRNEYERLVTTADLEPISELETEVAYGSFVNQPVAEPYTSENPFLEAPVAGNDIILDDNSTLRLPHRPFGSPKPQADKDAKNLLSFPKHDGWNRAGNW